MACVVRHLHYSSSKLVCISEDSLIVCFSHGQIEHRLFKRVQRFKPREPGIERFKTCGDLFYEGVHGPCSLKH